MSLVSQHLLLNFSKAWFRMVSILIVFVLFYSMLRLYLKGEQLEWLNIVWFTFYSFSEVVPFLTAIALVSYLRDANRGHEILLLELYDPNKAPRLLRLKPLYLCLTSILLIYLYVLKPHFKEEFRSGRLLLSSGTERAIALQGGHLWMGEGLRWIHNRPERVLMLESDAFVGKDGGRTHELGKGSLRSLGGDRLLVVNFNGGSWVHGSEHRGVRTMNLGGLMKEGQYFEILFRFNPVLLLWILSFLAWRIGRSSQGGAFLPMSGIFFQYLLVFHLIRPLGANGNWVSLALLPSVSLLVWFPFLRRIRP